MRTRLTLLAAALALAFAGPALAHRRMTPEDRAALFTQADADGDGKLTPAEFGTLRELVRQKIAAARFTRLDADGDGAVTSAELEAGHARRGKRCHGD